MIIPPFLKENDKIRIVAPAGKIKKEFVESGVKWLRSQCYNVVLGNHVLDEYNMFAGKDEDRLNDLQEALDDKEAKAIICARGGYGSVRLIGNLNFTRFLEHPKWIVGFSDITVFHNVLNSLGVVSIHGSMLRHFPKPGAKISESVKSLFFVLERNKPVYETNSDEHNRVGIARGELVGGNLSIVYSLLGTPQELNVKGKILFIEDIGEHLYHTDRMIQSLKQSGKLSQLAGLVVGDFIKMRDNRTAFGMDAYEIISNAVNEYKYPVCFGFPAEHDKRNLALVFGMKWELEVNDFGSSLSIL